MGRQADRLSWEEAKVLKKQVPCEMVRCLEVRVIKPGMLGNYLVKYY